jgi:hypothetical protein
MISYIEKHKAFDEPVSFIITQKIFDPENNFRGNYLRPIQDKDGFSSALMALNMKKSGWGNSVFKLSVWPHKQD